LSALPEGKITENIDESLKHLDLAIAGILQIAGKAITNKGTYVGSLHDFKELVRVSLKLRKIRKDVYWGELVYNKGFKKAVDIVEESRIEHSK
jgi:hypothetical protein